MDDPSDPYPSQASSVSSGSPRTSTPLTVRDAADMLVIQMLLSGLQADSLGIRIMGEYVVIDGRLLPENGGGRGRYARHVWQLREAEADFVDFTYLPDGQLTIRLLKKR